MKTLTGIALLVFAHFWPMDSFACSLEDGYLEPSNYNLVQEEEVDSEDSPWLTTVKHYVRIGTLRNYEQEKSELRKLQSLVRQTLDVQRGLESLVVDVDYPLLEADRLARKIVQANNVSDALTLIEGYHESFNPNRWARLEDLIHLKAKDPRIESYLRTFLQLMARNGNAKATELLRRLP